MKPAGPIKWMVMAGLLAGAALLTVYFHRVLGTATVFTHLFYVPIILAALWWGRAGILIAVILVGLLMTSHWMYLPNGVGLDDYFRAGMFLLVSWVVVLLRNRVLFTEAALQDKAVELEGRVRALSCLYSINRLRDKPHMTPGDIIGATEKLLRQALENGSPMQVRIRCREERTNALRGQMPGAVRLTVPITVDDAPAGDIEIQWLDHCEPSAHLLDNARQLADSVAKRLGKMIEHEDARAELDRYRHHLEDLVQDRTEELIAVNRRLREEVAERQKAEFSWQESEKQYRILFENAEEAIFIAQNSHIRFPNPALAAMTGYNMDYLLKTSFVDLIHPEDRDAVAERYRQRLAGHAVPHSYSFRITTAAGKIRWVEINTVLIQWQGHPATLNFLRDITARIKVEAATGQIRKMEAIGVLAGGIAHQFNNALSGITGHIDLIKLSLPDHPKVQRYSDAMLHSAHAMSGLTQQLLAYARGGKYQSQRYSLTVLVKDVLQQVASFGEKHIQIEPALSTDTPMVDADPVQMRMVMLSIIHNAAEAIEQDGKIRIETFGARMDATAAQAFESLPPGEYAGLSIMDNGKGMAEEVRERIFEPFFTTKFLGRGLGMAAAYGIVKNHGGYIYVDSEPGRGTVVHILLPPSPALSQAGTEAASSNDASFFPDPVSGPLLR